LNTSWLLEVAVAVVGVTEILARVAEVLADI
jgi:hypothetical protein